MSQHWYCAITGAPRYTSIGKNGKERNTTLRDAKANPGTFNALCERCIPRLEGDFLFCWTAMSGSSEFLGFRI